jgi:hypothetical protein
VLRGLRREYGLLDVEKLKAGEEREMVRELKLDVTELSAGEAAGIILRWVEGFGKSDR